METLEKRSLFSGGLLPDFGMNGIVKTDLFPTDSAEDFVQQMHVTSDGSILALGKLIGTGPTWLAKFHSDGTLDTSFGENGMVIFGQYSQTNPARNIASMALDSDGHIFVAGMFGVQYTYNTTALVGRLNADGSADTSFGDNGWLEVPDAGDAQFDNILLSSNRLVVSGVRWHNGTAEHDDILAKLNLDGTLDTSFAGDGIAEIPVLGSGRMSYWSSPVVDSQARISIRIRLHPRDQQRVAVGCPRLLIRLANRLRPARRWFAVLENA
jgi:uncharacterized delta-60 repeat protein